MSLAKLPTFDANGNVHVVVESPRGSRLKLKFDPKMSAFGLSRPLPTGLTFPYDWGFVPSTRGPDGDPLDAMVVWNEPSFPGVVLACRLIAVVRVEQNSQRDPGTRERNDRVLALPVDAARYDAIRDVHDLASQLKQELETFFVASTVLEGKDVKILEWSNAAAALALIKGGA